MHLPPLHSGNISQSKGCIQRIGGARFRPEKWSRRRYERRRDRYPTTCLGSYLLGTYVILL